MFFLAASMSLYGEYLNPGNNGENGFWYFGFGVADKAPKERPWKAWLNDKITFLFSEMVLPYLLANLIAAI